MFFHLTPTHCSNLLCNNCKNSVNYIHSLYTEEFPSVLLHMQGSLMSDCFIQQFNVLPDDGAVRSKTCRV